MNNNNNNTVADNGFLGSESTIGFSYGIGVSVAILLLITTITLVSYYCTRAATTTFVLPHRNPRGPPQPIDDDRAVEVGLDEVTLRSYPKVLYSEVKLKNKDSTGACCSICLAGYRGSDMVRVLAECEHIFHMKCVDPWLRLHPTCPVCRTSPMPTPMSTPLVEVVPFATRPIG
ncbi:hypothetical protein ACJIZ3_021713 [Penstemon smallii]|uniref:RING-type domain-containing protein n=1 Tax=Penstemon smallii TaxID=265156 RepID=A0ABD3SM73_9LAMI